MEQIRIDIGVYTALSIDLSEFDFTGIDKVVLTFKNMLSNNIVCTREFTTAENHTIFITPEESKLLDQTAMYDFDILTTEGKCFKNGSNGLVVLRRGCGECTS